MSEKLDCVVVTGAGSGIGRAVVLDLATSARHIVCISKSEKARETSRKVEELGGSAEAMIMDLSEYRETESAMRAWASGKSFVRIGLVLAAGVLGPSGSLEQTRLEQWEECWNVNVLGNLAVLKALLPHMIAGKFGRVVTFAGGGAAYAYPLFPAYAASKVATVRIAENLHEDLKTKGDFAVVSLAPGANDTGMLREVRAAGGEVRTVVDIGEPVAFVRAFLHSEKCQFSGCYVHVRDSWSDYLDSKKSVLKDQWKLRRVE